MKRRPPNVKIPDTPYPYTTRFGSGDAIGRRSDEHPVEAGSREGAAGDLRRRKRDMPIGRAVRRKSHDARGAPASDPQAAFGVEGHAVGIAPILFKDDEG